MHQGNNLNQTALYCAPLFPLPRKGEMLQNTEHRGEMKIGQVYSTLIKSVRRVHALEMEQRKGRPGQLLMNYHHQVVYEGRASASHRQQWIRRGQPAPTFQWDNCHRGKISIRPCQNKCEAAVQWNTRSSGGTGAVWWVWLLPGCTSKAVALTSTEPGPCSAHTDCTLQACLPMPVATRCPQHLSLQAADLGLSQESDWGVDSKSRIKEFTS